MVTQTVKDDGQVVECIAFEGSDRFAEQTGTDEQDEVGHHDEENRKCCAMPSGQYCVVLGPLVLTRTTGECVDNEATEEAAYNAGNGGNRNGARRLAEGNTADENDSFQALTQHNNERKSEQCPLSRSSAFGSIYQRHINTRARDLTLDLTLTVKRVLKLDAPFSLRVVQFEHRDSHDKNQDSGDELEYACAFYLKQIDTRYCGELTLPEILGFLIEVRSFGEPYSDEHGTNCSSNDKAERSAKKDLKSEGPVSDMKYVAGAERNIPGGAFCEEVFSSVGCPRHQRPLVLEFHHFLFFPLPRGLVSASPRCGSVSIRSV